MIKKLKKLYTKLDVHTAEVVRKSAASTVVKVAGMIIGLGVSIFLGRTLGADGLGVINLANRIVQLLIVVGLFGMRQVIIKEIAIAFFKKDWTHIGNIMRTTYILNGGAAITISVLMIFAAPWLTKNIFHEPRLLWPLVIGIIGMTPQVFSRLFSSGLIGYRKIWQSNLVDQTLSMFVIGMILLSMRGLNIPITINNVAIAYVVGRLSVTLSVGIYWSKLFRYRYKRKFISKQLLKTAMPLFLFSAASIIASSISTLLLGWLNDAKQVGLYAVSFRIAFISIFFHQITSSVISPKLAALYANGKKEIMEQMVQRTTFGLITISIFLLIILVFFGNEILMLWGKEFSDAYWIMIIMSVGQFINVSTGVAGLVLIMCGYERVQSTISIIFLGITIILNFILIYLYGVIGAALATAFSIAGENITRTILAKHFVGVMTLPRIKFTR